MLHKKLTLSELTRQSITLTKEAYLRYIKILGFFFLGLIVLYILGAGIEQWSRNFFQLTEMTLGELVSVKIIYLIFYNVIAFLIFAYINALMILTALNQKNLKDTVKRVNSSFTHFIMLSVFLFFLGFLALSPLYGISLLILAAFPFKLFFAAMIFLLFIGITLLFSAIFAVAPFTLLDKKSSFLEALKRSWGLIKGKEVMLVKQLIYYFVIIVIVQVIAVMAASTELAWLAALVNLAILFIMLPFSYSYFSIIYKELSA